ncbi:MAG: portal protein, partial [Rhabdochlamydiaceae bacterium]
VYCEVVPIREFFIDENARSFDGAYAARDCIRRYIMNIDDFFLMYKGSQWDQFDNARLVRPGGELEYKEYYQPPHGIDQTREVEVLHYWAVKPYDRFVIVANGILIRDGENPYDHKQLPFVRGLDVKKLNSFYGKGEPELLESVQDETNTLRRMIIDRNHLDIDKMFLVSNRIGLTDEDLIARPHGLIPTDDMNATKPVEYGDIPRSVEVSLQNLEDDAVIATGINPRMQSLPEASTATAASLMKAETLKRIELKLWLMKKEFFPRMAQLRTANILQFYSQPRLEKIVGEEESQEYQQQVQQLQQQGLLTTIDGQQYAKSYRQIQVKGAKIGRDAKGDLTFSQQNGYSSFDLKPKDFLPLARGGYVIRFEAGSNIDISKPLMQSKDLELFDRFSQIALTVPGSYDIVKLGDMILRDYDKNPDDYKPAQAEGDTAAEQLQMQLELAQIEDQMMMGGKDVPATLYASPTHTRVHLTFMNSPRYKDLGKEKDGKKIHSVFQNHVVGEMMAQSYREQQGAIPPTPGSVGDQNGQVQPGVPPQAASPMTMPPGAAPAMNASAGITNRPGGMASPSANIADIMPNKQTGAPANRP